MTKLIDRVRSEATRDTIPYPPVRTVSTPVSSKHDAWAHNRKYENFNFITTVLNIIAVLSLAGGVIGAALAVFQQRSADLVAAAISCISGLFGVGLFGALALGLVILRDIAHDQHRAALEAQRTAEAMERIANRQRST